MLESAWLFIGVLATLITGVALATQTAGAALIPDDDALAIVSGVLGFVLWGVWTFGALDLVVITDTGTEVVRSMPTVAFTGLMLSLVPGYIALTGPANIVRRADQPTSDQL